jgi:hypothetical protein
MKKIKIIILVMVLTILLSAQNYSNETLLEVQAETELAERLERLLEPIIGRNIVIVDLSLKYADNNAQMFGTQLNEVESLPGLPVAKSSGIDGDPEEAVKQAQITKKQIYIYVHKKVKEDLYAFIKTNVADWAHIDIARGDILEISKEIPIRDSGKNFTILYIVFGAGFLLLMFNMRTATKYLGSSMKNVNVKGLERGLHLKGQLPGTPAAGEPVQKSKPVKEYNFTQEKPLPIEIIQRNEDEQAEDKVLDFQFVENLSVANFAKLIQNEKKEDIAFVFSNISLDYVKEYFIYDPSDARIILRSMVTVTQKSKGDIEHIRNRLFTTYKTLFDEERFLFDGKETGIKLINQMPSDISTALVGDLQTYEPRIANEIRKDVFLFEDIQKLDDNMIKALIKSIHQTTIVSFLASVNDQLRDKFTGNLTKRAAMILEEDVEMLGELNGAEKITAIDNMLNTIRSILKYN